MRRSFALFCLLSVLCVAGCVSRGVAADTPPTQAGFEAWVAAFTASARQQGVSNKTLVAAFGGIQLNQNVLKRNSYQPEFVKPVWSYLETAVSPTRVKNGRAKYALHQRLLRKVSQQYQVPPQLVAAIWGLETAYGATFGGFNVVEALATLGYAGRRAPFWEQQLLAAMQIIDGGDIAASQMIGSWAGAMGHTQFMPTSFQERAVDYDQDGKRDIWNSYGDVFASTANFMQKAKWKAGETWGAPVKLPRGFDWALADSSVKKSPEEWAALGVKSSQGGGLPRSSGKAYILLPAGHRGPAFMVLPNFRAIMRYNNSTSYALAVGLLSDRIAGAVPHRFKWPLDQQVLNRAQSKELQSLLTAAGFDTQGVDGILGANSRTALRAWQLQQGLVPDAFATIEQLVLLRRQ